MQKGEEIVLQNAHFIAVRTADPLACLHLWMWMSYIHGREAGWEQGFAEACNRMSKPLREGLPA
jgi:hypothetical protein